MRVTQKVTLNRSSLEIYPKADEYSSLCCFGSQRRPAVAVKQPASQAYEGRSDFLHRTPHDRLPFPSRWKGRSWTDRCLTCLDGPNHSSFRHRQIVGFALRSATVLLRTADSLARILLTAACLSEPHDMHKVDPATFDPVEPIAFAVLYLLLTGLVTYVYTNLGLVHLLVILRGLLCCCAGYLGWTVHCAVTTARRCSAAVQHLPGPDLGHLGLLKILSQRADWHCALTDMADRFGPIYKARALFFRVRCSVMLGSHRCWRICGGISAETGLYAVAVCHYH